MLIKIILNEFAFKNIKRLAGNSFLWKFVPFSYCPGKKRKSFVYELYVLYAPTYIIRSNAGLPKLQLNLNTKTNTK